MDTSEKNQPPPSYVEPMAQPYAPGAATGYEGQQMVQYPQGAYPPGVYYPPSGAAGVPSQLPPPSYSQQQQASSVVVVGNAPPVTQNVMVVHTVRPNVQIPELYPGVAFCMFPPGLIETIIRASITVMLVVLIAVAGAAIDEESEVVTDGYVTVDARGWRGAAGWIIFVAGTALITEGIILLLRFLNPRCFNNSYGVFGGLDITKCVLAGIGLFIGCVITGIESAIAADDYETYCEGDHYSGYYTSDNNRACEKLESLYRIVLALTVINVVCMVLILILFVWDIIYLSAGFNSKVPVPRGTEQYRQ